MNDQRMTSAGLQGTSPGATRSDVFGKYRLIAEIGRGGMSEVFLTLAQGDIGGFQKLVVIKLLHRALADDDQCIRMFLAEARLAAQLNHANVVQTYDMGEELGRYYIAMEYLEGQSYVRVRRAPNASKLIPLTMHLQILIDVLGGLHYAHELTDYDNTPMQLVHRDVTPSNVFVTYDGQVKLVDFGIAKLRESDVQTKVGVLKGKARYVAPEHVKGDAVDRRADIYSVGVMLWEILSKKSIWNGRSELEILRSVAAGEAPQLTGDVPGALRTICMRAMAHHPVDRYETAEAMRVELDAYLAQYMTPNRGRELGAAVSELFRDERAQIRQTIETQIKGSRPHASSLPQLPTLRTGGSSYEFEGHTGTSAAHRSASPPAAHTRKAEPRTVKHLSMFIGGLVSAAVIASLVVMARQRDTATRPPQTGEPPSAVSAPFIAPAAGGATSRGVTPDTIMLGMSGAFSGESRELGIRMKLGLETAFAIANDAGGVEGRHVKLLALDDGYDAKRALVNVQQLIQERKVFALVGNIGTPTAKEALPYVLSQKVLFFGAVTGSSLLRRDPPDRYVFNYRASYEEETAKMVGYLVDVKKVPDHSIVVFAQNDSYGDAGFDGAAKTLRKRGHSDELFRVGYERNSLDVDDAVAKVGEYHDATVRVGSYDRAKHPVKAIIMVSTYKAAAKFIQKIRDRRIDATFLNVSFVGSNALAEELAERGPGYGTGVIVTQVVPHFESNATGVLRYRESLARYHPDQEPDFVSLEGFVVGQLLIESIRRAGRDLDTERLVDTLERLRDYDPALGGSLNFGTSQHQASHKVWGTVLDAQGVFRPLDME